MTAKKLYRSRHDKMLTGLAGGLGEFTGIDPTIIRIVLVIFEFATGGILFFFYLLFALIVPKEPRPRA